MFIVWLSLWLTGTQSRMAISPRDDLSKELKVCNLLDVPGTCWDKEKVEQKTEFLEFLIVLVYQKIIFEGMWRRIVNFQFIQHTEQSLGMRSVRWKRLCLIVRHVSGIKFRKQIHFLVIT